MSAPNRAVTVPTAGELYKSYRDGASIPSRVTAGLLTEIDRYNPRLDCYITVLKEAAMQQARASDERFAKKGPVGPLDGVPVSIKDMIYIKGVKCTAGSKILSSNVATYDSPVSSRLKEAGAVLVGTTNLHEFASGVTSSNPHYGAVRNPWDLERVSGGSSGGSAVSVAAGLAAASVGTDTGGSVRIPAALCGILGLKPTYGRISRIGVVPLAGSLDTVGVLAATAWDAAAMLSVLAGHREGDVTAAELPVPDYLAELERPWPEMKVAVPHRYFFDLLDDEVQKTFSRFVDGLTGMRCDVRSSDLPDTERIDDVWLPIRRGEMAAFHQQWFPALADQYGEDVRKAIESGMQIPAYKYINAQNLRVILRERFLASMKGFDLLVTPATCIPAPLIGQDAVKLGEKETPVYAALNRLTLPFNLVGFPAISVPMGKVNGLPVGAQVVARPFDESLLLRFAAAHELASGGYEMAGTSRISAQTTT